MLFDRVLEQIVQGNRFDPELALEVAEYQLRRVPLYKEFAQRVGVSLHLRDPGQIPFFPVEFFKRERIFAGEPEGFFLSSGTGGDRSRSYYNHQSLELYKASALRSFPFPDSPLFSLIPPVSLAPSSSLAWMIGAFESRWGVTYLNDLFEIDPGLVLERIRRELPPGGTLFATSLQLLRLAEEGGEPLDLPMRIIETGGYKATGKIYRREELYGAASRLFPKACLSSEYGMAELFSQFYSVGEGGLYLSHPYNPLFGEEGEGLLQVFDFANLYTLSALLVPDRVVRKGPLFDVRGRVTREARGCGYVFK